MTDPITRSEVLAAQALATDAPGPACDAVRSLAATLLDAIDKLKRLREAAGNAECFSRDDELIKWKADEEVDEFVRKFEGGE